MAVFYILLLVPIVIQHATIGIGRHTFSYERKNRIALVFFFILFTMLVMFRHETIGNDTRNYIYYFNRFSASGWSEIAKETKEYGLFYFIKTVSLFSKEPQFFLAVTAIAINLMLYPTYKRLCIDASLTIVLFCILSTFVMMFSGIRQMLAIGIGVIAYEFTRNKKPILFIIAVIVAMSFHASAFMLVFMYPIYYAKITKKWLIAAVPALIIVFIFNKPIFSFLALIIERYTQYEGEITSTGAYTMLILFSIFTVFTFLISDEALMDKETLGLRNFLLFAVALQMFAPLHPLAMRMNYYYIIFIPLLIPKIISYRNKKWEQIAVFGRHIMVIFFLVYFFISAYGGGNLNVFPYHFFWEKVI